MLLPADNWFIILKFATIARRWRLSIPGLILVQITGSEHNDRLNVAQGVINGDRLWCRRGEVDHGIEGNALSKSSTARMFLTENPLPLRGCEATSPSVESMLERSSSTFDCTVGIAVFSFSPNCRKACIWRLDVCLLSMQEIQNNKLFLLHPTRFKRFELSYYLYLW